MLCNHLEFIGKCFANYFENKIDKPSSWAVDSSIFVCRERRVKEKT